MAQIYDKYVKPILDKGIPGLKAVERHGTNYWTGMRLTKPAGFLIGAGAILATTTVPVLKNVIAGPQEDINRAAAKANAVNVGQLAATRYEGTGARSDLGASGDLVFGLHNSRRGK